MPASAQVQETASARETEELAAAVARALRPGDVVAISGELGAGKTTFVRGACRQLGVRTPVTSPTFTVGRRYDGSVSVSHLDLYRLDGLDSEEPGLVEDFLGPERIAFVEWPEQARSATLAPTVRVALEHLGGDRRRVRVWREPAGDGAAGRERVWR